MPDANLATVKIQKPSLQFVPGFTGGDGSVHPRDHFLVAGQPDGSVRPGAWALYDGREGVAGVRLLADGKPVDRAGLLLWFTGHDCDRVEVDQDLDRYMHAAEARFFSR